MRFKKLDAYPSFNWHIGGGDSPYENLLFSIYGLAVFDVRTRLPEDPDFLSAASFLKRDPYGLLSDEAKKEIVEMVERRKWERKNRDIGTIKRRGGTYDHGRIL